MRIENLELTPLDGAPGVAMSLLAPAVDPELVRVDVVVVQPGASLPKHPAGSDQAFYVVSGSGQVAGDDNFHTVVGPGDLVSWDAGEQHTIWATTTLTAVIVQRRVP